MSKTVAQIFATNPTTVVADTDLYYLVQSPYTPGSDAAITGASLKATFGTGGTINPGLINQLGYYAAAGSTISGLSTLANGTLITSGAGAPSISQTLPSIVQGNITSLGTITSGVWNGSIISGTYGGTGVNNGARTITIGGSVSFVGAFTFAGTLTGNTAVTFPTSGTLATTSQLLISPLTTKGDIWVWSTTNDRLPVGATNGQVLQANSVAATGLSYSTATYPSTATNAARILRSDGTNWIETTATFADIYAASSILYSNGASNVAGLATANNGLLVTGNTGIPSLLAGPGTSRNLLMSNAASAPSFTTETYAVPGAIGNVMTSDGTNWISAVSSAATSTITDDTTTNATMYPVWVTAATGSLPLKVSSTKMIFNPSTGRITTTSIAFSPTTGGVLGTTTNDSATTGYVGEYVESIINLASAVTLTTATSANVTSISLTAGDWDVWADMYLTGTATAQITSINAGVTTTSATIPSATVPATNTSLGRSGSADTYIVGTTSLPVTSALACRQSLSGTTTVYLVANVTFTVTTVQAYGIIRARRVR